MSRYVNHSFRDFAFAGLVKPKKYDWKDSNLALFGSDTEKQVKSETRIFHFYFKLSIFRPISVFFVSSISTDFMDAWEGRPC